MTKCTFPDKSLDPETGLYYYGARYLDPKYSMWLSCDPALGEYVTPDENKKYGVFNHINLHLYHYAGNNPIKYVDPTGMLDMKTSSYGIDFITSYEGGFRANIYDAQNPSRVYVAGEEGDWTIGFGHKLTEEELSNGTYDNGITEETAKSLLASDLSWFEQGVNVNFEGSDISQNEFDALVSLGYNIGRSRLVRSQIFADSENNVSDELTILSDFRQFTKGGGNYMEGLDKRRYDEAELYLYGDYQRNNDLTLDNPCNN
jgi:RHS repeat-associated protein